MLLSPPFSGTLVTESKIPDEFPIPLQICLPEILQETTAFPDHLQETSTAVVVLLVPVEVATEVVDAGCQEGDLDWGAPTILFVELVLRDDFFAVDGHSLRASAGA